jgi:hypothetical protein
MTYVPLPNLACIAGLIAGTALIFFADAGRAETRPCTEQEASKFEGDENLPVLCEVMTVRAAPIEQQTGRIATLDYRALFTPADRVDVDTGHIVPQEWRADVTS